MKKILTIFAIIATMACMSVSAQAHRGRGEEWKEKMMAEKIAFLTLEVGLTPEEAQAFWPIYNKWWDDRQSANSATRKALKSIKKLNKEGNYSEVEMKKLIKTYTSCLKNESDVYEVYIEEFYKILPVEKVAKIFVAEDGFRKKLTQMWREWYYEKETNKPEVKR